MRTGDWGSLQRRAVARMALANLVGAGLSFATATLVDMSHDFAGASGSDVAALIVYLLIWVPFAAWRLFRSLHGADAWLRGQGVVGADRRRAWLQVPMGQAMLTLLAWFGGAVMFGVTNQTTHKLPVFDGVRTFGTILLGGLAAAGVVFLLLERCLKPLFARIFSMDPPDGRDGLTLRVRLLVAWVLGSAVPLLIIGMSFVGSAPNNNPHLRIAVWALTGVGLLAGAIVISGAARSITEPLGEIRDALARVDHDDLDTHIAIYDGSEIGLLQTGYNQMVAGLRDRRQLEDLFGRHVGVEVARLARRQGVQLGGERRETSAIFIDLVGSTRLAQSRPAIEVMTLLNSFFATVVECIEAEGGWINKFEGDGALCVFGAPAAQADHATRALRASRMLRLELLALNATHPDLSAGIGVSSGEVAAGNVGGARRYEYTVIGDPVNEAARLTDYAKERPGGVLASQESIARASTDERLQWIVADELALRGRSRPTVAFEPRADTNIVITDISD